MTSQIFTQVKLALARHSGSGSETFSTLSDKLPAAAELVNRVFDLYSMIAFRICWLNFANRTGGWQTGYWIIGSPGLPANPLELQEAGFRAGYRAFRPRRLRERFPLARLVLARGLRQAERTFYDQAKLAIEPLLEPEVDYEIDERLAAIGDRLPWMVFFPTACANDRFFVEPHWDYWGLRLGVIYDLPRTDRYRAFVPRSLPCP